MFETCEAYLLLSPVNRFYFTGLDTSSGCVILTQNEKIFLTDFRYIEAARKALTGFNVLMFERQMLDMVKSELTRLGVKTVGFEDEFVTVSIFKELSEELKGFTLVPVSNELAIKRSIKTEEEISRIAAAQVVAQKALSKVVSSLKPGITEREMAAQLLFEMQMLGAECASFETIVAFKENTAMPHHKSGNKRLEKNDLILVDMGAKVNGYCSDMTRTFALGNVGEKLEQLHALVLEAQEMAIKKIKAGMTGREADSICREFFKANGFEKEFGHSLGHGVGIDVHESPRLSQASDQILSENMVVTVEPGLYIEGLGGVRIEDMLVVGATSSINLTNMDKTLY